jgi:oxygen-dependent protoporphyrinogen oxidase
MESGSPVVIVGAGISGLTIAFRLKKKGIPFLLLEESAVTGGKIGTLQKDGFELDLGPVSCARNPALDKLIHDSGLEGSVLLPSKTVSNRFIYSSGRLHPVVPHPVKLLTNNILSLRGRLNIFKDLRVKQSAAYVPISIGASAGRPAYAEAASSFAEAAPADKPAGRPVPEDESVTDFVQRHFGKEVLQKLFDPVLSGIYAGDPDRLSVLSVLPLLKKLERENGSVIRGLWRNRKNLNLKRGIISFQGGFQSLTETLVKEIGPSLHLNARVEAIKQSGEVIEVVVTENGEQKKIISRKLILTLPAPGAALLLANLDLPISETLKSIPYNPVSQVYCVVENKDFNPFDGFGFLVPSTEKMVLMGAVHNSGLFAKKAPAGYSLFTLFFKGRSNDEATFRQLLKEFTSILKIRSFPKVLHIQSWREAIPQFEVGHYKKLQRIAEFERNNPLVHLAGNYISGVSVGDCVKYSDQLVSTTNW